MELLYTIAVTIFALVVLVTVHEYGHFWVARRCGVHVERFSIGFGTALFKWRDRLDTEYVIAAIPLGGYVKMLDERVEEVTPGMQHLAFNRKPVLSRIAIVAAGPLANLLLAVVAYWFVFITGESGVVPVIKSVEAGSVAEIAGLEGGQEIVGIDGHPTPTWQAVNFRLLDRIGDTGPVAFSVRYPGSDLVYDSNGMLENWLAADERPNLIGGLGIEMYRPDIPVVLNEIVSDSPAEHAGLRSGDHIVSADGDQLLQWTDWVDYVRARPEQTISIEVARGSQVLQLTITPARKTTEAGEDYGQVGLSVKVPPWPEHMLREFHYGPVEALVMAGQRTWDLVVFTLKAIKKMLTGLISHKNLSGPITIAKVASASADSGLEAFVAFMALLSVSLGVLNLLPVPVLDGGHLMYYIIELLVGRPVPMKVQMLGYQVGLFIIVGVMMLALYNDFARL